MMGFETLIVILFFGVIGFSGLAYLVRVWRKGRARHERLDREGGSWFLGKSVMEMGYWALQPIADGLVALNVSANALTWSSVLIGAIAGVCLAHGHFGSAGLFAVVAALLDALDGWVARKTRQAGPSGKVLDSALDRYVEFFLLGGLLIHYRPVLWLQVLVLLAICASFMVSYVSALAEIQEVEIPRGSMRRAERMTYLVAGLLISRVTIDSFETPGIHPMAIGYPTVLAVFLIAGFGNYSALSRLAALRSTLKRKAADASVRSLETPSLPVRSIPRSKVG